MTIPFNPRDNNIIISVSLHSHITWITRLAFDTGASVIMIPQKIAEILNLKIDPNKTIEATTASKIETVPVVTIPKVSILDAEVHNVEAIVKDLPQESYVDGLLGLSFIRHFNVNIDFKRGKLTLRK